MKVKRIKDTLFVIPIINKASNKPTQLAQKKQKFPKCKNTQGELKVASWLDTKKIKYITQKTFEDCKDKRCLSFDFYLPKHNTCIEFQGRQHYDMSFYTTFDKFNYDKAVSKFKLQQYHDILKRLYCQTNNIHLIEIKYNEDVNIKLSAEIK